MGRLICKTRLEGKAMVCHTRVCNASERDLQKFRCSPGRVACITPQCTVAATRRAAYVDVLLDHV